MFARAASAVGAGYGSLRHLLTGEHPSHLALSAAAAVVGMLGNELVAEYKIRTGKRIGSVSLARTSRLPTVCFCPLNSGPQ